MPEQLPTKVTRGDPIKADDFNAILTELRRSIVGASPINVIPAANGIIIALGRPFPTIRKGIGKAAETIANRTLGDINIWDGTFGSEEDTETTEEMFNLGPEVAEDDWVMWELINGQLAFVKLCS